MTASTDIRTNQDLADLIAATIPGTTAEIVGTGGGFDALEVRHPDRPEFHVLIGSADSTVLLTDRPEVDDDGNDLAIGAGFRWAVYVGEYSDDDYSVVRDLFDVARGDVLELVEGLGLAAARREVATSILAHVHAWTTGKSVDEIAAGVLSEVGRDMDLGRVPRSVRSFSALHDHVDANGYLEGVAPVGESGDPDADLALANAVTDRVHAALARGEHDVAPDPLAAAFDAPQLTTLDDGRTFDAGGREWPAFEVDGEVGFAPVEALLAPDPSTARPDIDPPTEVLPFASVAEPVAAWSAPSWATSSVVLDDEIEHTRDGVVCLASDDTGGPATITPRLVQRDEVKVTAGPGIAVSRQGQPVVEVDAFTLPLAEAAWLGRSLLSLAELARDGEQ